MSSLKSQLPSQFSFHCDIALRITDLNYGGHVGNDRIMALLQEARVQFLAQKGYSELELEGIRNDADQGAVRIALRVALWISAARIGERREFYQQRLRPFL